MRTVARLLLGAVLAFAGVSHLTFARQEFQAQVPRSIPIDEDVTVVVSGIVEIALGPAGRGVLGYYLDARAQGRGLATRAVDEIVTLAFGRLGLHRIEAATRLDNEASQRVLERNGFRSFGVAHDYLRVGGDWQDHVLYERIDAR